MVFTQNATKPYGIAYNKSKWAPFYGYSEICFGHAVIFLVFLFHRTFVAVVGVFTMSYVEFDSRTNHGDTYHKLLKQQQNRQQASIQHKDIYANQLPKRAEQTICTMGSPFDTLNFCAFFIWLAYAYETEQERRKKTWKMEKTIGQQS